jgi:flavin-dependent dehydrogenase
MTTRGASEFEIKAIRTPKSHYDVAILGGGLAGLTLALHLKRARPQTSVLVAERREAPAPEAAFKVGESTVEVGAYYYREMCGMADHLESRHLRKAGLRFFFPAGENSDITRRVEFVTPDQYWNHQIDRGRFENEAFDRAVKLGADAFRGFRVQDVEIGGDEHKVVLEPPGGGSPITVGARWIADASGRANILRRKLGLQDETGHNINAAWFRLGGGLDVEDFGAHNQEWVDRVDVRGFRKLATVHLLDQGYWVWLIPLASGPHSIGVCADPRFHPFDRINEFDKLLDWFREHEPQLAAAVEPRRNDVMDFLVIEDFSYRATQTFSNDRWTLVGEAGGFIDAFYSPGSDFIGYTNNFSKDLICRDLDGEDIEERTEFYNFFFYQLFDPTISLYKDQYQFFGNPQVMLAKNLYDNTAYFSTLAYMFLHEKMTDLDTLAEVVDQFQTVIPLLQRVQDLFRDWHQLDQRRWEGVSILSKEFTPMIERQRELSEPFEEEAFKQRAIENIQLLKALAIWLFHKAAANLPEPPDPDVRIDALGISLHPEKWEEDGLYSDDGMTLAEALELLPGIDEFWLESRGATVAAPA